MRLSRLAMESYADDWMKVHSAKRVEKVGSDVLSVAKGPKGTYYVSASDVDMNDPVILQIKAGSVREAILNFLYTANELDEEFENDKKPDLTYLVKKRGLKIVK